MAKQKDEDDAPQGEAVEVGKALDEFGRRLRDYIERSKLSLTELSERSSISKGHISLLSLGKRRPSRLAVERLAGELGLTPRETHELIALSGCGDDEEPTRLRRGRPLAFSLRGGDGHVVAEPLSMMTLGKPGAPGSLSIQAQALERGSVFLRFCREDVPKREKAQAEKSIRVRVEADGREYYPWIEILPGEIRELVVRASKAEIHLEVAGHDGPEFLTCAIPSFMFGVSI